MTCGQETDNNNEVDADLQEGIVKGDYESCNKFDVESEQKLDVRAKHDRGQGAITKKGGDPSDTPMKKQEQLWDGHSWSAPSH